MLSLLKSRRARILTILAGVGLVILWYLGPYPRGVVMAHVDHARGYYEIKTYGGPLSPEESERYAKYNRLLQERYEVELEPVAGCVVTWSLVQFVDGYNSVSKQLLKEKHGRDIFEECATLAQTKP